jgi:hypothetical protein
MIPDKIICSFKTVLNPSKIMNLLDGVVIFSEESENDSESILTENLKNNPYFL